MIQCKCSIEESDQFPWLLYGPCLLVRSHNQIIQKVVYEKILYV